MVSGPQAMRYQFEVPTISCRMCAPKIKTELNKLTGVYQVNVDSDNKIVSVLVRGGDDAATEDSLKNAIEAIKKDNGESHLVVKSSNTSESSCRLL